MGDWMMSGMTDNLNKPPAYWEDDRLIVRASAFGGCLWELAASAQGHDPLPPPKNLRKAFDEGHAREQEGLEKLEAQGWTVDWTRCQEEHDLPLTANVAVRFHWDGFGFPARWPDDSDTDDWAAGRVLEVKWLSAENFRRASRAGVGSVVAEYSTQLAIMMHQQGAKGLWVFGNKETGEVDVEPVHQPPVPLADLIRKGQDIYQVAVGEDVVETGRMCDDPTQFPCRFYHLHTEATRPQKNRKAESGGDDVRLRGKVESGGDTGVSGKVETAQAELGRDEVEEFDALMSWYVFVKGQEDENKMVRERAKADIKALLGDMDGKVSGDRFEGVIVSRPKRTVNWAKVPEWLREQKRQVEAQKKQVDGHLKLYEEEDEEDGTWYIQKAKKIDE